ncbi:MAG: ribosome maturation factor RimM [Maricaulaceae bacterium]
MAEADRPIMVGAVAGAFGVQGEAKVKSFTADPDAIRDYAPFCDAAGAVILTPLAWRSIKGGFAVRFKEVASREAAAALKSTRLFAPRNRLPGLKADEFYHADLIGLRVEDLQGRERGRVRAVYDFGAGDLLEIIGAPGVKGAWLLPFTREEAPHVDMAGGAVIIDPSPAYDPLTPEDDATAEAEGDDPTGAAG